MARNEELRLAVTARVSGDEKVDALADDLERIEGPHRADVKVEDHGAAAKTNQLADSLENVGKKGGLLSNLRGAFSKIGDEAKGAAGSLGPLGSIVGALPGPIAAIGGAAVAAGAALVKFATGWESAVLAADKFARTSGVGIESASRWIAVADDIGVSSEEVAKAFDRMQKSVGTGVLDKLGLSDLKGADATQTFLNIAKHLQGVTDETQRAAEASQIFGKGWTGVSELIMSDTATIAASLKDVAASQVFSDDDAKQAKALRAATDDLSDSFHDITLDIGEAVTPALADLAKNIADVVNAVHKGVKALGDFDAAVNDVPGLGQLNKGLSSLLDFDLGNVPVFGAIAQGVGLFSDKAKDAGESARDLADAAQAAGVAFDPMRAGVADTANETERLAGMIEASEDAIKRARDTIDSGTRGLEDYAKATKAADDAQRALQDTQRSAVDAGFALADAEDKASAAYEKAKKTTNDSKTAVDEKAAADRDAEKAVGDVADAAIRYAEDQAKATGATFTAEDAVNAQRVALENLKKKFPELAPVIDSYIGKLNAIPPAKSTTVTVYVDDSELRRLMVELQNVRADYAAIIAGGISTAPQAVGAAVPGGVIINMPAGANGADVVAAQRRHSKRNGGYHG